MLEEEEKMPKMSQSLLKFIEQDNKAYEEELKKGREQKDFNKSFFQELQKTMVLTASQAEEKARQERLLLEMQKRQWQGDFFGGPSSGAGGFFGGAGGGAGGFIR